MRPGIVMTTVWSVRSSLWGDKENPIENPATGPLFVKGALTGDVLKVEILDIQVRDWGRDALVTYCRIVP